MKSLPMRLIGAVIFLACATVAASARADGIARSFNSKSAIESGRVVAISLSDKTAVEPAPAADPTRIYGVVVDQSTTPVTVQQKDQKIFVATEGVYPVLVSSENGAIKSGDYLSMSSQDGIAAKLVKRQTYVLGRASQNFDGTSGSVETGKNGSAIGKISVQITPGKNPSQREDLAVPALLRELGESIAGKPLSAIRIYAALITFVVTATIVFSLLFAAVRNGMVAIGRNPLSKHSVMQSLTQVIAGSVIVFISGLSGIYLLLRL